MPYHYGIYPTNRRIITIISCVISQMGQIIIVIGRQPFLWLKFENPKHMVIKPWLLNLNNSHANALISGFHQPPSKEG